MLAGIARSFSHLETMNHRRGEVKFLGTGFVSNADNPPNKHVVNEIAIKLNDLSPSNVSAGAIRWWKVDCRGSGRIAC
jgi:hypothetical protein